jgi:putative transposase
MTTISSVAGLGATADAPVELRAYRLCLDPSEAQIPWLAGSAGAARWAFNYAVGLKVAAHQRWRSELAALVEAGTPDPAARKLVEVPIPTKPAVQKHWQTERGDARDGVEGVAPWWWEYSTYAFQSAFADADRAWSNWVSSRSGTRAGRAVGYPRFKKKGRARDSFRIHHNVKQPTIRPDGYRRLIVPRVGSIRLHSPAKPLVKAIEAGAVIQSVTISRQGHRWYAAVLVKRPPVSRPATRAQRAAGRIGVDLGVSALATLSTGELVPNPRLGRSAARRLARAQRRFARTEKGSARRRRAAARVGRVAHITAERRATGLHTLTKRLATGWAEVAVEDLHVAGMTASAKGTIEVPGSRVRQKSGLNREILDVSLGEVRRQLGYKSKWYGARLLVCDRWYPSSKTCSDCGAVKTKLTLADRVFKCEYCGYTANRDVNAARNIAGAAVDRT